MIELGTTVTIGNILTVLSMAVVGIGGWYQLKTIVTQNREFIRLNKEICDDREDDYKLKVAALQGELTIFKETVFRDYVRHEGLNDVRKDIREMSAKLSDRIDRLLELREGKS